MKTHKTFGMDLGTTNSTVSVFKDGHNFYVEDFKQKAIPSIVCIKNGNIVAGTKAKNTPGEENKVKSVKRSMGKGVLISVDKKQYKPEEISAEIIKHCVNLLNEQIDDDKNVVYDRAVITVPAYFNIAQKDATRKAGELAGIDVCMLLEEPTAAAINYTIKNNISNGVFMVYDLGGGTFDVSIIEKIDNVPVVLATAGDNYLGGDNFDKILANRFLEILNNELGYDIQLDIDNNQKDKNKFAALVLAAENVKKNLSVEESVSINYNDVFKDNSGVDLIVEEFTRKEFENLIKDKIVTDTISKCEEALQKFKDSGRELNEIDSIIMVGGSRKIPYVKDVLTKKYIDTKLIKDIQISEPDLAVGSGAGIVAATLPIILEDEDIKVEVNTPFYVDGNYTFTGKVLSGDVQEVGVVLDGKEIKAKVDQNREFSIDFSSTFKNIKYNIYAEGKVLSDVSGNRNEVDLIAPTPVQNETIRIEIVDLEKQEIVDFPIVNQGESLPCEAVHYFKINEYSREQVILPVKEGYREIYKLIVDIPQGTKIGSRIAVKVSIDVLGNVTLNVLLDGKELQGRIEQTGADMKTTADLDRAFDKKVANYKDDADREKAFEKQENIKRQLDEAKQSNDQVYYADTVEKYKTLVQELPNERMKITEEDFDKLGEKIKNAAQSIDKSQFDMSKVDDAIYFGKRAVRKEDVKTAEANYQLLESILTTLELKKNPKVEFAIIMQILADVEDSLNSIQDVSLRMQLQEEYSRVVSFVNTLKLDNFETMSNEEMQHIVDDLVYHCRDLMRLISMTNIKELTEKSSMFTGRVSKD